MPPNLHTLPQDIVIIIIGFLARRFDVFDPEGELKEMCNYSLISRNFLYEAQKMLWINLTFGSNQSVLKWLESDATKRGDYRTVQLDLNHEIDELIIEKLLDSLNQSVSGLCLALTNSISSQVFQHNKLKGE